MSRIDRIRRAQASRRASGTANPDVDAADRAEPTSNLPVPVGPAVTIEDAPRHDRRRTDAEFRAHLMGQEGQRRGLRAGPPLLVAARSAYASIEYSGSYDRRARKGRKARADV